MTPFFPKSRWSLRFQFNDNWRHLVKYWLYLIAILSLLGVTFSGFPVFLNIFNGWQNGILKEWLTTEGAQLWLDFSQSFIIGFFEVILSLLLTTIVFVVIVVISGRIPASFLISHTTKRTKLFIWVVCLLLLFLVIPPIIIFLFQSRISVFSGVFWLGYSLEILISFFIVVPFIALWWLALETQPLDDTLEAWEEQVVEEDVVEITQERYSFFKWIEEGEIAGYYELMEAREFGNGLHSEVLSLIQQERERIKDQENGKAEKLKDLLETA